MPRENTRGNTRRAEAVKAAAEEEDDGTVVVDTAGAVARVIRGDNEAGVITKPSLGKSPDLV